MGVINFQSIKSEFTNNRVTYLLLTAILLVGFIIRVYRTDQLLAFHYDQGRDALVIWDLIHKGEMFLIGPTTGIEGIFRGGWYYWLITPFYFLGQGNPVWPAVFLAFTTTVAAGLAFYLGKKIHSNLAGLLAALFSSLSFALMMSSRWLSNPTPMLVISMLLLLFMFLSSEGKKWAWVGIGFMLGMAMQFGSAAEVFYFPGVLIFAILNRKSWPHVKIILLSVCATLVAFVPQILFDIIHNGILREGLVRFLIGEESFKPSIWETVKIRLPFYYNVFYSKLDVINANTRQLFFVFSVLAFAFSAKKLFTDKRFLSVLLLLISPLIGMLFFQGNQGNVYDYYFTGYFLIFILFLSVVLAEFAKQRVGKIVLVLFLLIFLKNNLPITKNYINGGALASGNISLGSQLAAIDWIYQESAGREYNVDVYVPPVIPHSYDYLFLWQGTKCGDNLCNLKLDSRLSSLYTETNLLYTLYEIDPPHPERLKAWLDRQVGIGRVEKEKVFGGITVQERTRISNQ